MEYADRHGFDAELADAFATVIGAMDRAWMADHREQVRAAIEEARGG